MSKYVGIIIGAAEIAAGVLLAFTGVAWAGAAYLIEAGIGTILVGVGTLIAGAGASHGVASASRNPVAPWNAVYGQTKVGGTVVHLHEFGDSDKYLDIVVVVACHQCESVDMLYFDDKMVQIGSFNTSFTPVQQTIDITTISRVNNLVTVVLPSDIPFLSAGVDFYAQGITFDESLNGKFQVESIISRIGGGLTFTYVCGGTTDTFSGQGQIRTEWVDFGRKVYMETLLGTHTSTFTGMLFGTPGDGDPTNNIQDGSNPWGATDKLLGRTCVFLRLHYNDTYFGGGIPTISFLVSGKNNIYDHRTGTTGYTTNAALCIADYLAEPTWGFRSAYGSEIPYDQLDAAANICDESVTLANGSSEARYMCNGQFPVTMRRGDVLQNLLTSCAGRLTFSSGQFVIWPGAWRGTSPIILADVGQMAGQVKWAQTPVGREIYNGVKGTFISPSSRWNATDFPPYAQDTYHGYSASPPTVGYFDINVAIDGERRWLDIQLPFTSSVAAAQRIAKIELMRRRNFGTATFGYNMSAYQVQPMDVLAMTVPYLGWSGKLVEVLTQRFIPQKVENDGGVEAVMLGVEFDVQETNAGTYVWEITEENTPQGYRQTTLPSNTFAVAPIPPSNIINFKITSGPLYDSQNVTITGTGDLPTALNDFAGCSLWNVINSDFDHPQPIGDAPYRAGDAQWNWQVILPIPPANQTWQIYAVSYGIASGAGAVSSNTLLCITSPTSNETPHVTASILSGIPGNITGISITSIDQATDPQYVFVTGSATPPSPLNGFIGTEAYYQNISGGSTDGPHDEGFHNYSGTGAFNFKLKIPAPPVAETLQLFFVSANQAITEVLVTSGASESAFITISVAARGGNVPAAPNVGAVTAVVVVSDPVTDGSNHYAYNPVTVQAPPSVGWVSGMQIQVDIVGPLGLTPLPVRNSFTVTITVGGSGNVATSSSPFQGVCGDNPPDFDRPIFGVNEAFQISVTALNSAGSPTASPVLSAPITITGGGSNTPAPNLTSITPNIITYVGNQFYVTSTFNMPSGSFVYINRLNMRILAYSGGVLVADNEIGDANYFDWGTNVFTFKHGPYQRPASGASQNFAVGGRVYSGTGVITANPTISSQFAVNGPVTTGAGLGATGVNVIPSTKLDQDGGVLQYLNIGWTDPANPDITSVEMFYIDLADTSVQVPFKTDALGTNTNTQTFAHGAIRAIKIQVSSVTTTYRILWNSINAAGALVASVTWDTATTATTGSLNASRLVSLGARLSTTTGSLDIAPAGITYAYVASIAPGSTFLQGGGWTSGQVASIATTAILAGTINVAVVLTAPTLVVSGSTFTINIDTVNGMKVTSITNGSAANMTSGFLTVAATTSGNFGMFQANALQFFDASSNLSLNISASSSGHFFATAKPGSSVSLTGLNSFFNVNGTYRANGVIVIGANGSISFPSSQIVAGAGNFPAQYIGRLAIQLQSGGIVAYVPLIGVTS
jgi:hypothetical protein